MCCVGVSMYRKPASTPGSRSGISRHLSGSPMRHHARMIAAEEAASLGLDPERLAALLGRAAREVDAGRLPSCQLAVARHGRVAVATLGDAADHSRYLVFSVTKAVTAAAAWLVLGDGRLTPETKVAEVVPAFARDGFDAVTIEHLLT